MSEKYATKWIEEQCEFDKAFKYNIEVLDKYDFSEFLTDGRSLWNLREVLEEKYEPEVRNQYGIYLFDDLDGYDTTMYFTSRYNVDFQEYTDWVVRHENGTYEQATRRTSHRASEI